MSDHDYTVHSGGGRSTKPGGWKGGGAAGARPATRQGVPCHIPKENEHFEQTIRKFEIKKHVKKHLLKIL